MRADMDLKRTAKQLREIDRRFFRVPPDVRMSTVEADGVRSRWVVVPQSGTNRTILYFHGGGFFSHMPCTYAAFLARLCRYTGARGLLPNYRLAPAHPFPAAPDDCLTVYRWLLAGGVSPDNVVLAGDSAGANLALATLVGAKRAGLPMPACAILMSPVTDMSAVSPSAVDNAQRDPYLRLPGLLAMRDAYVGSTFPTDSRLSPCFADFEGFPPLLFQVGNTELLRDDSVRTSERARFAGVNAICQVWEGMPHVFQMMRFLPESRRALETIAEVVGMRIEARRQSGDSPVDARAPVRS